MNEYELMTILHPRLSADETAAAIASVEAQIAAHGGEMLSTDVWGRRRMAYPIDGNMDGTYVLMTLRLPPAGAAPLEAWLLITDPVIRHLLIRGIIPYQGRDRDRDDRDERDDRDDRGEHDDRGDRGEHDDRGEREHDAPAAILDGADAPEEMAEAVAADE